MTSSLAHDTARHRAHGFAWLFLALHIGAHVAEEALTGFLTVWTPVMARLEDRLGIPLPHVTFVEWLSVLVLFVSTLIALSPLVYRGVRWLIPASYVLAVLMIANGVNHLVSPWYLGRFLPGQFTSPLMILASAWLILRTWQVTHASPAADGRAWQVAGSAMFFLVAPATVAGWVPYAITGWELRPPVVTSAERVLGGVILVVAVIALIECFARFAMVGRGTPAPVVPTESLVVSGLYRHTRNPMYVAVVAATAGQALLLGQPVLFAYAGVVWLLFHLFVVSFEEPTLSRQFTDYAAYRAHVPRWLPRLRPWRPASPRHQG